ncbi:hypothetical protein PHSY_005084 [Pseudozyma hubeiensis SY62]|uniref:Uncharacterized protein n=1 Tax=Pseudozyma hubeiensis (strain SY62) TaxID=1305764 RepID=R9P7W9_PSEHS|nr:hypothetical protein PHSY_005084 [Pseudozyma hubeiensis SY62]GAC97498.1 hypothetical protein PHSY_005084 [Pseudozyma hubeiensis SY62]
MCLPRQREATIQSESVMRRALERQRMCSCYLPPKDTLTAVRQDRIKKDAASDAIAVLTEWPIQIRTLI